MLPDENRAKGSRNFCWNKGFSTPDTFPQPPPKKARPLLINFSMKQTVTAHSSAWASAHPSWKGYQAQPGFPDPGPCHVPLWGLTSARSPKKAHWGSETTSGSTGRPSGALRGKGLAQEHIINRQLSWEEGLGPLTSRAGLEAWEVGCGGWRGGGKEALCQEQ